MQSHLHLAEIPTSRATPAVVDATPESVPRIRVVIADDHDVMLGDLRELLDGETDLEVVGEASDLASAADSVRRERPDVLVLDLRLLGSASMETIGQLRERAPATEIVVLSTLDSPALVQRALTAGACGFVSKSLADDEVADAIRAAMRGRLYLSPQVAPRLEELHQALTGNDLTPREVEVLRLISLGHTSVEVARKLHLSPRTVETHRAHIHKKLGLATRAQLVGYALRRGLLAT
jgi:two-component system response regulator NreC